MLFPERTSRDVSNVFFIARSSLSSFGRRSNWSKLCGVTCFIFGFLATSQPLCMTLYVWCFLYSCISRQKVKNVLGKFQLQQFKQAVKLHEMCLSKHHCIMRCFLGFQVVKDVHANFILNLSNTSINGYIYHEGRNYTEHAKQWKKTLNELSIVEGELYFCKNVQITVLRTYMESALIRYNGNLLSSQRSKPQQLQMLTLRVIS